MPLKDVLALGCHLASKLEYAGSCDTLGKWMSHHLAELITSAENEGDPDIKIDLENRAAELILKIWAYRHSLKGDINPVEKYEEILAALSLLYSNPNSWELDKLGKTKRLSCFAFWLLKDIYAGLLFLGYSTKTSGNDFESIENLLPDQEKAIYKILEHMADDVLGEESISGTTPKQKATDLLINRIDVACEKLQELKQCLNGEKD